MVPGTDAGVRFRGQTPVLSSTACVTLDKSSNPSAEEASEL